MGQMTKTGMTNLWPLNNMHNNKCAHVYDVALCGNTVRNVVLGPWQVGHPWVSAKKNFQSQFHN